MKIQLFVGDRNYSSWSLRPWLVLRWARIPFEEMFVSLDQPGYGQSQIAAIRAVSPSGKVPALHVDDLVVWDSLAISEWAAQHAPQAQLWPRDPAACALARAAACEMHSGFTGMRRDLSMNLRRRVDAPGWLRKHGKQWAADTQADLDRFDELVRQLRARFASRGPWLAGERSIADAFYTPLATRLRTYGVVLGDVTMQYCAQLFGDNDFRDWEARALADWKQPFSRANIDGLYADPA